MKLIKNDNTTNNGWMTIWSSVKKANDAGHNYFSQYNQKFFELFGEISRLYDSGGWAVSTNHDFDEEVGQEWARLLSAVIQLSDEPLVVDQVGESVPFKNLVAYFPRFQNALKLIQDSLNDKNQRYPNPQYDHRKADAVEEALKDLKLIVDEFFKIPKGMQDRHRQYEEHKWQQNRPPIQVNVDDL